MEFKSLLPFGRSTGLSRATTGTDPFTSLRREMDRMFDDFTRGWAVPATFGTSGTLSPKVNIAETDKGLEVTADLPGIDQKDIEINLADGILTLKAEHKAEKEEKDEKKHYHLVERSFGTFMRSFELPFEADTDKVEASFEKGVLKISVPRSAAAEKQVKKIAIKGS
jgi:HSP20 family protein